MKKLVLSFFSLLFVLTTLFGQQNPNDMIIYGYVTNTAGLAIANQQVCVTSVQTSGSTFTFNQCVNTNDNGWYYVLIPNGSVTGPNLTFKVSTVNCNNTMLDTLVANAQGTIDVVTANFVVCNPTGTCSANFVFQQTSAVLTYQFYAANATTPPAGFVYSWNFGDGSASDLANPVHAFPTAGVYNICLMITSPNGCTDTQCQTITIGGETQNCSFSYAPTAASNNTIIFTPNYPTGISNPQLVWNFGDGSPAVTGNEQIHTFLSPGTYHVCMNVIWSNTYFCNYCTDITITGDTYNCNAEFGFTNQGNTFTFIPGDPNTDPPVPQYTYLWNFGNGLTSTLSNPTITFTQNGTYEVCLTVSLPGTNCSNTQCQTITVTGNTDCQAYFYFNPSTANSSEFAFFGVFQPSSGATQWSWNFGDNTESNLQNPTHVFTSPGTYHVCLTVTSANCQPITYCKEVTVLSCNASFNSEHNGNTYYFHPTGANSSENMTYSWNFGNGTTSDLKNPVVTFTENGTYNVCLTVSLPGTNCSNTQCQTITVGNGNECPVTFTASPVTSTGAMIFTPNVPSNLGNLAFLWNFGDGTTSELQTPAHVFPSTGQYYVCLTAFNDAFTCTFCDSVFAYGGNTGYCNAAFTFVVNGNTVNFTYTGAGTVPSGMTFLWNFGNGVTSNLQNPVFTFTQNGTFEVCLTVSVPGTTCSNTICHPVTITGNNNCTASFSISQSPAGNGYVFYPQLQPASSTTQVHWNFGDGTTSTLFSPTHVFPGPGTYNVCLTAYFTACPAVTVCQTITVQGCDYICPANFTYQQSGAGVHFYTTNAGTISGNCIYSWDFGDNTTSDNPNPVHIYSSPGTYTVCLTTSNPTGECQNQYCQNIVIGGTVNCQASFTYTYGQGYNISFFGAATPMSTSVQWQWNFGDGTTSSVKNPVHTFEAPGTYNVCLTVIFPNCPAVTQCQAVTILPANTFCNATFVYQIDNANVYFHSLTTTVNPPQNIVFAWDFGDGTTSSIPHPVHTYIQFGNYTVCLTVTNSATGCSDTYCQQITIGSNGSFGGQVFAGDNAADAGTVYLLSVTPNTSNGIIYNALAPIQQGGYYQFQNIPYGDYLIQAHLSPNSAYFFNYLPTYYGDVLYWSQATFISVGEAGITVQYNIHLISTNPGIPGGGIIGGDIIIEDGGKQDGGIADVLVMLMDSEHNPVASTYSDENGKFIFTDLAYGTYILFAEVWGKDPIPANIILDEDNSVIDNTVIYIGNDEVITSLQGKTYTQNIDFVGNPFPNPASDELSIAVGLKKPVKLVVNIYNVLGTMVFEQKFNFPAGVQHIFLPIENLNQGVYQIRISTNNGTVISRNFSKLR